MQVEVRFGIIDEMPVIFGIVTAVEGPGALAVGTVNIAGFAGRFVFTEDQHVRLDQLFNE